MTNWRSETTRFAARLDAIDARLPDLSASLQDLPGGPFKTLGTSTEWLYYQCCLSVVLANNSTSELAESFKERWKSGCFLSASLCARLLVEMWGVVEFADAGILDKFEATKDLDAAAVRVTRLNMGAKGDIPLPWGDPTGFEPIHAMEFVRAIRQNEVDAIEEYNSLCNASHPSFLQHSYLLMAGKTYDNWGNKTFAEYADKMLERLIRITEMSINGVVNAGVQIAERAIPIVKHWD